MVTEYQPNIEQDLTGLLTERSKVDMQTNRASAIGDPCLRRLVYMRTQGSKAKDTGIGMQGVFQTGTDLEAIVTPMLNRAGNLANPRWRISQNQTAIQDSFLKKYNISGSIDGIFEVEIDGHWQKVALPDIKTCSSHVFASLSDFDSLSRYSWMKKYPAQLYVYALGMNLEKCVLIFVNKQNIYEVKTIWFPLDYQYAESLLQKAELINKHVATNTLPEKINQPDECSRCAFAHICMPELQSTGNLELCNNEEVEELLNERAALAESKKKFDAVERQLEKYLVKGQDIICGDYIVQWQKRQKKAFTVAASEFFVKEIICTKQAEKQELVEVA